mmetsp:Transcript_40173/g.81069  ORF Transcript_40173/g.81069 Transcript_40173/m.81069 type:complete len:307 (+) Transcript_40173:327-1247(+)
MVLIGGLRRQQLPHEGGIGYLPLGANQVRDHLFQLLGVDVAGQRISHLLRGEDSIVVGVDGVESSVQAAELRQVAVGGYVRQHRPLQGCAMAYGGQGADGLVRDGLLEPAGVVRRLHPVYEEGVLHALLHGGPRVELLVEHGLQQRRQLVAAAPMALELVEARHPVEGRLPDHLVAEAREALLTAREELVDDHTEGVHVALRRPEASQPDLWRHVARGAPRSATRHEVVREAEVDDYRGGLPPVVRRGDHDVALLEVAVRDVAAVQVRDALEHLVQDLGQVDAGHTDARFEGSLDEVAQVSSVVRL